MENTKEITFESPGFFQRLRSMLGVDFYRLFHTPMFYIFLAIAALIPAMILSMTGMDGSGESVPMYSNAWQMIAAQSPLYVVHDMGEYANMNMVFIFDEFNRTMLVSLYIVGHRIGVAFQIVQCDVESGGIKFVRKNVSA
jgi:hypothetical protein